MGPLVLVGSSATFCPGIPSFVAALFSLWSLHLTCVLSSSSVCILTQAFSLLEGVSTPRFSLYSFKVFLPFSALLNLDFCVSPLSSRSQYNLIRNWPFFSVLPLWCKKTAVQIVSPAVSCWSKSSFLLSYLILASQ